MWRLLLTVFFLQILSTAGAQVQIASPKIINYTSEKYKAGIQNWDVAQDSRGILYFANNEGLLAFNGSYWSLHRLPNLTVTRSIEIDSKGRIFVGGQDEIGYFYPDENGLLKYHSLVPLIRSQDRNFADIWNIAIHNDEVFFRSTNRILHYKDGSIVTYKPETEWVFLGEADHRLFAQSRNRGLKIYDNGVWKPYGQHTTLDSSAITSIIPYAKDTLLISTLKSGLYLLANGRSISKKTDLDKTFFSDRIYCTIRVNDDWFAVGTTSAGMIIIDRAGKLVQRYSYQEGLQQNNVRAALIDRHKGMWMALDDGIDFIAINSPVKSIYPDKSKSTTGYAVRLFGGNLYAGTSNGLYAAPVERGLRDLSLSKGFFSEVSNAKGQVWNLDEINNSLLMGHEDGLFVVEGNRARQIYTNPGTWLFQPVSNVYPSSDIVAGTYLGLQHIRFSDGAFSDGGHVEGLYESLRFIAFDGSANTVWAAHPYRGIYRLVLSDDRNKIIRTKLYTADHGLPATLYNYLFVVKGRVMVAANDGIYEYNEQKDRFQPSPLLNPAVKGLSLQYLKEDRYGNVWFVTGKKVGVIDFNNKSEGDGFTVVYFPEIAGKVVGGFEHIYPLNDENIFIGGNKGIFHLNYRKYRQTINKPDILLGLVKVIGAADSIIFGGYVTDKDGLTDEQAAARLRSMPYAMNSLHFEFSSSLSDQHGNIEYRYQLEGFDGNWSVWSDKTEKDYTNLPEGTYTFKVMARNNAGNESSVATYSFKILPPWYRSAWSYVFYFLALAGVVWLAFKWQKRKHLKAQEHMSYLHQLELDRSEKEIVRLKNEQLEADVNFKNRELAAMTMHLVQRGEVLARVKDVVSSLVKKHDIDKENSPAVRQLLRLIREAERGEDDWERFTMHFNQVNADFFSLLKDKYPDITPNELKLCAYIKMNLSSKEIAQLMNITIKAIEVGRYRLRKKLRLRSDTNLYDFLIQVSKIKS